MPLEQNTLLSWEISDKLSQRDEPQKKKRGKKFTDVWCVDVLLFISIYSKKMYTINFIKSNAIKSPEKKHATKRKEASEEENELQPDFNLNL